MKYFLKRFWPFIIALVISALFISYLNQNDKVSNQVFIGVVATLLTLYISVINYYHTSDKFFKELFTEFNQRYDKLNNFLNGINDETLLNDDEVQKVMDYLNLCAEEYMWVRKGRIPEHIWISWKNGIKTHIKKKPIREVFDEEKKIWKSSYYGFFNEIE